ncbi:MAG: hypothetical protein R3284_07190 [Rubricoccaceae bacterium]|nr:hypothetical protein [Rubricoccaceae bacterium]
MKRLFSFFLLVGFLFISACSGSRSTTHNPRCLTCVGTSLGYQVSPSGDGFGISIIKNDDDGIQFAYAFAESENQGTVAITPDARETATVLLNYFGNENYTLTNQTSVWLSTDVFYALKRGESVALGLGNGDSGLFSGGEVERTNYDVLLPNGETLSVRARRYTDEDKGYELIVLDDNDNPLILKMSVAFDVALVSTQ